MKYSTPVLVSVAGQKKDGKGKKDSKSLKEKDPDELENERTEDLLRQMLPPKEYVLENGQLWIQTVLCTPATRTEVIAL